MARCDNLIKNRRLRAPAPEPDDIPPTGTRGFDAKSAVVGRGIVGCRPVLMIGGWTVAAALQPGSFDQVTGTISALAGYAATDRWVMTLALAGVGICHVVTALALRPAAAPAGWRWQQAA